jgi:heme/copper-type cytochrome/quinol oxidase subunit 2
MRGTVRVLPPEDFDAWVKAQQPDSNLSEKWANAWDKIHPEYNKVL